jgi:hypothetical protein
MVWQLQVTPPESRTVPITRDYMAEAERRAALGQVTERV